MNAEIFTALGDLIETLIPDLVDKVVRGLGNGVPTPLPGYACMTATRQKRIATNETTYNAVNQKTLTNFKEFSVQIDFYGPNAADWANIIETVLRDEYAVNFMGPSVTPLYCNDAQQAPLVNGEMQYEERWILSAAFEFNPVVALPQDYYDTVTVIPVNVEATY